MAHKEVQVDLPEYNTKAADKIYLRPCERVTLAPKEPIEEVPYGKGKSFSRKWILQDGRELPVNASEAKDEYKRLFIPVEKKGIRRQLMEKKFWHEVVEEIEREAEKLKMVPNYCSEYESNFGRDDFQPRELHVAKDKNLHLKYPLYGTGSSAITFYSETIKKTGKGEILEKFRRTQDFTKPMGERLDDGWVL